MSTTSIVTICSKCGKEFYVTLEWLPKKEAIEVINHTTCPECGSDVWYFTDAMR